MGFNCLFNFLYGLSHGLFINNHYAQVMMLILMDITSLVFFFKFIKLFEYKIITFLTIAYKLSFLFFNVIVYIYSFNQTEVKISYDIIFCVTIFVITAFVLLQISFGIILFLYHKIKFIVKLFCCNKKINKNMKQES